MQRSLVRLSRRTNAAGVCWSCLVKSAGGTPRRRTLPLQRLYSSYSTVAARNAPSAFANNYFFANNGSKDGNGKEPTNVSSAGRIVSESKHRQHAEAEKEVDGTFHLPQSKDTTLHNRRQRRKEVDAPSGIPLDASSQLSALSSASPQHSLRKRFFIYLSLSKPRLTFLMILTTTTAYSLFPVAVDPLTAAMNLSPLTLLNLTTGTALSSACANALNMLMEPEHDAKMSRTRSRPLVRGLLTKQAALGFAMACGTSGVALLHFGVNPTVAFLSALNIFLYAGVYTPMKRLSVANTWVGAVVGGIPPLMGWAAAAGQASTLQDPGWRDYLFDPATSPGGWLLAALLFAWQFPHFNAIAYTIRHEYANAGYKMLASVNVRKNGLIALRYSLAMVPVCAGLCYVGVTGWSFLATSSAVNGWMIRQAWRFWRSDGARGSARGLFWASVWHLPLILALAMFHKKGLWERFINGGFDDEELLQYARDDGEPDNAIVLKDRVA